MFYSKCKKEVSEISESGENVNANKTIIKDENNTDSKLIGFSTKINDPSFEKYRKESKSWSYIFSFIIAAIAIIAFPIYGKVSREVDWPFSLYYGIGIGGMFILIAFSQSLKRNHDETWDGVVIDKKTYKKRKYDNASDMHRNYIEYVFTVKRDNGKKYKHRFQDQHVLYDYYNAGDKVRHHKGFMYYEKYDKSKDNKIICAACMAFNYMADDFCVKCKRPLLK